jgi:glutathione S-transferase
MDHVLILRSARSFPPSAEPAPQPPYTVAAVLIEQDDGRKETIMGTEAIARRLDELETSTALFPKELQGQDFYSWMRPVIPHLQYCVAENILRPHNANNADWFHKTRQERNGFSLADHAEVDPKFVSKESLQTALKPVLSALERHGGPFFMGDKRTCRSATSC